MGLERYVNQWVEIIYVDRAETITQRIIKVLDVKDELVTAFCSQKKNLRKFNRNQILAIRQVRPSRQPELFNSDWKAGRTRSPIHLSY